MSLTAAYYHYTNEYNLQGERVYLGCSVSANSRSLASCLSTLLCALKGNDQAYILLLGHSHHRSACASALLRSAYSAGNLGAESCGWGECESHLCSELCTQGNAAQSMLLVGYGCGLRYTQRLKYLNLAAKASTSSLPYNT